MKLSELAQTDRPADIIHRSLGQRKPHHAYLMVGENRDAMLQTAKCAFAALNCLNEGPFDNCNHCDNCSAIFEEGRQYTELILIEPDKAKIGVADVRSIEGLLSHYAVKGSYRGVIINGAQELTEQAQNALLKIVEEPPSGAIFFLLTTNVDSILMTIRSRCQLLYFAPEPFSFEVVFGTELEALVADADRLLAAALDSPAALVEESQLLGGDRRRAQQLLDLFEFRLFDALAYQQGCRKEHLYDPQWCQHDGKMLQRLPFAQLMQAAKMLAKGRALRIYNVNPRLVGESALLCLHPQGLSSVSHSGAVYG